MADRIEQKILERKTKLNLAADEDSEDLDEDGDGTQSWDQSDDEDELGEEHSNDESTSEVDMSDKEDRRDVMSKTANKTSTLEDKGKKIQSKTNVEPKDTSTKSAPPKKKKKITRNFTSIGLSRPLLRAIEDLGYPEPTPIQAAAIPLIMMGKDVLGIVR